MALLADPWVRFPPHTEAYAALMSGYERLAEGAIEHEPRRMAGRRLVTRRESWLMSAPTLLDAARDGDGLSVRRIDELRRRHHLPPRVFVQPDSCQFWRRRVVMGVFRWRGAVGVVGAGH